MTKIVIHSVFVVLLTIVSQLGGLAWLIALFFKRRFTIFVVIYLALSVSALWIAPLFGRVPLPCLSSQTVQLHSKLYCALNRQYVVPELRTVLIEFDTNMKRQYPDTQTRVLDANFPFLSGFPLLPHLSHHDGRKVDLAFYYADANGYLPGKARSPLGYFAFEDGPTHCPKQTLSLRWDMAWLQSLWPEYRVDQPRMSAALSLLSADERIGKIFIEPHMLPTFGVRNDKIRFQGCRAARHDDHIHIQL